MLLSYYLGTYNIEGDLAKSFHVQTLIKKWYKIKITRSPFLLGSMTQKIKNLTLHATQAPCYKCRPQQYQQVTL